MTRKADVIGPGSHDLIIANITTTNRGSSVSELLHVTKGILQDVVFGAKYASSDGIPYIVTEIRAPRIAVTPDETEVGETKWACGFRLTHTGF